MTGRQNRWLLWAICGLLVICLAGIELPEFLTLTNDTSNDFTTSLISSEASGSIQIDVADSQEHGNLCASVPRPALTCYCLCAALDPLTRRNSRDLLALHSSWRT